MAAFDYTEQIFRLASALLQKPGVSTEALIDAPSDLLLTYLNAGFRWIQDEYISRGCTTATLVTDTTLGSSDTSLSVTAFTQGWGRPIRIWERNSSSDPWLLMEYRHPLPINQTADERVRFWDYYNTTDHEHLFFPAHTADTSLHIELRGRIADYLTHPRQTLVLLGGTDPLAFYVASMAAQSARDYQLADRLYAQARSRLDTLINRDTHLRQLQPSRQRRPRYGLTTNRRM